MKNTYALLGFADLIQKTDTYFKRNFILILSLGAVAGLGRFFQEGGYGEITPSMHGILEVVINGARLLIIFLIIGQGYVQIGFNNLTNLFRLTRDEWSHVWATVKSNFSNNSIAILTNFIILIVVAVIFNIALFALFDYTTFLDWLKSTELLSPTASKWPVLLFFKNISIIPFTLIFETLFVMWIVERNKLMK
ncbi:hypothetical protein [Emticicia sp. C21]|uniref:hypothetical protein n=1 Tax=Emticicia sp. C21 TaxID=2302915 RepID=UPI000E34588F|nr:hypothetical protein [Emticicia sp. C21]RFS15633.1 hypothetical protein D0T08_15945 [Emticicia sp. C21]